MWCKPWGDGAGDPETHFRPAEKGLGEEEGTLELRELNAQWQGTHESSGILWTKSITSLG